VGAPPVEESENENGSGAVPEVTLEMKLAFGGFAAATGRIVIDNRTKRKREANITHRRICTRFAIIEKQLLFR